jgi:hypothetical protein
MSKGATPSSAELLRVWCETTLALVERHALPSVGPPMTGLAERLVEAMFEGTLAPTGQRDWDVESSAGRIHVKAM